MKYKSEVRRANKDKERRKRWRANLEPVCEVCSCCWWMEENDAAVVEPSLE
jgi:hypothetical protein